MGLALHHRCPDTPRPAEDPARHLPVVPLPRQHVKDGPPLLMTSRSDFLLEREGSQSRMG